MRLGLLPVHSMRLSLSWPPEYGLFFTAPPGSVQPHRLWLAVSTRSDCRLWPTSLVAPSHRYVLQSGNSASQPSGRVVSPSVGSVTSCNQPLLHGSPVVVHGNHPVLSCSHVCFCGTAMPCCITPVQFLFPPPFSSVLQSPSVDPHPFGCSIVASQLCLAAARFCNTVLPRSPVVV